MTNPILEKVTITEKQSFAIKEEILPYIKIGWHYHPEYELVLFTESTGKRFIGDHTDYFGPNDFLLLGPYLPHYMRNDEQYYKGKQDLRIRAVVIHFSEDFCGKDFFEIPEMVVIKKLLQKSSLGLKISGETQAKLAPQMEKLLVTSNYDRLRVLLDILHEISICDDAKPCHQWVIQNFRPTKTQPVLIKFLSFYYKITPKISPSKQLPRK